MSRQMSEVYSLSCHPSHSWSHWIKPHLGQFSAASCLNHSCADNAFGPFVVQMHFQPVFIYVMVTFSRPYFCDLYIPRYANQTQKSYQSIRILQVLLCLCQSPEQLSFCKERVDWFDLIYSWQIYVGSFNHLNILKMLIHRLFNSLSNIASDTE